MSIAATAAARASRAAKRPERPSLSPEKGNELIGLVLLAAALLLAGSFASYHPSDPSLFHELPQATRSHNWIGPAGAQAAALGFSFFGLSCFLLPLFLLVAGWRRLRRRTAARVVGRGFGSLVLLAALPGLVQLLLGGIPWRGETLAAGGAFGAVLVSLLDERLSFAGSLLALASAVAIGTALVVQSTLGQLLAAWRLRLRLLWQDFVLARARRRERREKERARRRVITKHLQRVVEEKQEKQRREDVTLAAPAAVPARRPDAAGRRDPGAVAAELAAMTVDRLDLPLRGGVRRGEIDIALRRASGTERAASAPAGLDEASSSPRAAAALPPPYLAPGLVRRPGAGAAGAAAAGASGAGGPFPRSRGAAPAALQPPSHPHPEPQPPLPFAGAAPPGTLPPVSLLQMGDGRSAADEAELVRLGETIRSRCAEFGVEGTIEAISPGPVITVFEFQPAPGVKVSHIVNLQDDLALALKAESVRIERLPGRSTLGLEVPNRHRSVIRLGSLLADERFRKVPSVLTMALGTTIYGEPYYADLATMPHLLVAGATGAGKSVGLQSMITSLLYRATRDEVQFIFIDPKRIELGVYADIPHLKAEVVVDPKKAANALRWAVAEMERRYRLLAEVHVRSIAYYNRAICDPEVRERLALSEEAATDLQGVPASARASASSITAADLKPLPYYVVIIDELAALMMVSSSEVETSIARLAQMARAVGIHLIVATQR